MSDTKEYKEHYCMSCEKYKSGTFHPVRKNGRLAYWQCDDCRTFRLNRKNNKPAKEQS